MSLQSFATIHQCCMVPQVPRCQQEETWTGPPAPGAAQYLEELISIFEEYGWDWSYHAFRESPYWDVELDAEAKPAETDRRKVLLKYFRRNR